VVNLGNPKKIAREGVIGGAWERRAGLMRRAVRDMSDKKKGGLQTAAYSSDARLFAAVLIHLGKARVANVDLCTYTRLNLRQFANITGRTVRRGSGTTVKQEVMQLWWPMSSLRTEGHKGCTTERDMRVMVRGWFGLSSVPGIVSLYTQTSRLFNTGTLYKM
jgi:hypothetical protein